MKSLLVALLVLTGAVANAAPIYCGGGAKGVYTLSVYPEKKSGNLYANDVLLEKLKCVSVDESSSNGAILRCRSRVMPDYGFSVDIIRAPESPIDYTAEVYESTIAGELLAETLKCAAAMHSQPSLR